MNEQSERPRGAGGSERMGSDEQEGISGRELSNTGWGEMSLGL